MLNRLTRYALLALLPATSIGACRGEDAMPGSGGQPSGGSSTGGKGSGGRSSGGSAASGGNGEGGQGGDPNGGASVTIQFRAQIGDAEFACGKKYKRQGLTEVEVTPQDLRLFVSEVRLITQSGDEVPVTLDERSPWQVSSVALLDFEDGSGACKNGNSATNTVITGKVAPGDYAGLVFSTAVPKDLNHADPATLPAPLQAGGMTWGWLMGYKFIRAEVVATATAGAGDAPGIGLFHLGSTGCDNRPSAEGGAGGEGGATEPNYGAPPAQDCAYQNRNEINLEAFDPASDAVIVDVGELMAKVDLNEDSSCHSMQMQPACEAFFPSVGVDLMTGEATTQQTTFLVGTQ